MDSASNAAILAKLVPIIKLASLAVLGTFHKAAAFQFAALRPFSTQPTKAATNALPIAPTASAQRTASNVLKECWSMEVV